MLCLYVAFKMKCHTIEVRLQFSNYPQQPLFVGGGRNPPTVQKLLEINLTEYAKSRLTTLKYSKLN